MSAILENEIGKVIPGQLSYSSTTRSYYFCRKGSAVFFEKGILMSFTDFKTLYPLRGYNDTMRGMMRFQSQRQFKKVVA